MKSIFDVRNGDMFHCVRVPGTAFEVEPMVDWPGNRIAVFLRGVRDFGLEDRLMHEFAGHPMNAQTFHAMGRWLQNIHDTEPAPPPEDFVDSPTLVDIPRPPSVPAVPASIDGEWPEWTDMPTEVGE